MTPTNGRIVKTRFVDVGGQGSERTITATLECVYYIDADAFSTHRTSITTPHSYK